MKNLINRAKYVVTGEEGSIVEWVVLISVVLVLSTVLFLFRDSIREFFERAMARINTFNVQ